MSISVGDVFCDWLDTTYFPNSPVVDDVGTFVLEHGASCSHGDERRRTYRFDQDIYRGSLVLEHSHRFSRVSASGSVLQHLRSLGLYTAFVGLLSVEAHNVSRMDLAQDRLEDGAVMIKRMRRKYSKAGVTCALGRKSLPVSYVTSVRDDGKETGSFYAGHRTQARVTGRQYDKQAQMLAVHGERIPSTVRTEITVRGENGRSGAGLYDALHPEKLFYHVASPVFTKAPKNVSKWVSGWGGGWAYETPEKLLPAEKLARMVDNCLVLDDLKAQAAKINGDGGSKYLLRLLERRLGLSDID